MMNEVDGMRQEDYLTWQEECYSAYPRLNIADSLFNF